MCGNFHENDICSKMMVGVEPELLRKVQRGRAMELLWFGTDNYPPWPPNKVRTLPSGPVPESTSVTYSTTSKVSIYLTL